MTIAESFLNLFSPHSLKSFGEYKEGSEKAVKTIKHKVGPVEVQNHLEGRVGLGLVPLDFDQCGWGAIDIDNHDGDSVDHKELAIKMSSIPGTVVTRSKSGGAHIYFFFSAPVSGKEARSIMHQVAMATGLASNEIFPKQNRVREDGFGNWLNLPYFGSDESNRYGINEEGERISLANFVATIRANLSEIETALDAMSIGAPPCIEHLLTTPPKQGHRNMALFSLAVFFKRSKPEAWKEKTQTYALTRMVPPLPEIEIRNVIRSVARTDYTYKCTEPPLLDLCNKDKCRLARHGLTIEQQMGQGSPVGFERLIKYLTEPPVWDLFVKELGSVRLSTRALMSHSMVREAVAEKFLKMIPRLKDEEWSAILSDLMEQADVIDVPVDSTASGLVWAALLEYTSISMRDSEFLNPEEDEEAFIERWEAGLPVLREKELYFSGQRFIKWLRQAKRAEGMQPSGIYMALKDRGVSQKRLRIGGEVKRAWVVPAKDMRKEFPVYKTEDEF